jgi:predicted GIY-YIG superfamily endonuclease
MNKFLYVYILVSKENEIIHYTGITQRLRQRLGEHNRGKVPNSMSHRPWRIETVIAFKSEKKARTFERYLKSGSGREFARRHF